MIEDRRRYTRFAFPAGATLSTGAGEPMPVRVLDLSLRGVLVETDADWPPATGEHTLVLRLADESAVTMVLTVVHRDGRRIGLACQRIDLDSLTHLRRLAELNLGDAEALQRELAELAGP